MKGDHLRRETELHHLEQRVIDAARARVALGICHDECESYADRKLIAAVAALDSGEPAATPAGCVCRADFQRCDPELCELDSPPAATPAEPHRPHVLVDSQWVPAGAAPGAVPQPPETATRHVDCPCARNGGSHDDCDESCRCYRLAAAGGERTTP